MKTDTEGNKWYALYTKPRAEKKVLEQFRNLGIEAYLPLNRELRRWSDRKRWIEVPVISSYIFISIPESEYRRVFEVKGIVGYVCHKGEAVVIPDHEIEAMRKTVENKLDFSIQVGRIQKGQTITITSGPLKGVTGVVTNIKGTRKLYLHISHIGYSLVVDLHSDTVSEEALSEQR